MPKQEDWNNEEFEEDGSSEFYGEEIKGEEILQDGTYYTDVVQEAQNKKKFTIAAIFLLVVLVIGGLGFVGKKYIIDNPDAAPEPTPTASAPAEEPEEYTPDYTEATLPTQQLIESPSEVPNSITAFVEGESIQTGEGTTITFNNADITATVNECVVERVSDYCHVAEINSSGTEYYVYFLKDAVNSRFFENAQDFEVTDVEGISAAATMVITSMNGSETPVLLLVEQSGSGMMVFSTDNNMDSLKQLQENIN